MIYPGAASSIRFEKMREGIVDYEKLRIMRGKAARSSDPGVKQLANALEHQLKIFTTEKEFRSEKLETDIREGQQLLEELSEKLKDNR